ncbi:MAG: cysteine desulfurase NifS [Clostridia bacterium]|nr:cysteine desulfurase NifS [Clostridia bacterium]
MKIRYFDHAATTPVSEVVLKEMLPYFNREYGNASSMYSLGRSAKRALEEARNRVANAIGAKKHEIYFTSCGSESDNLAIKGVAYANREKGNHIITSKIEHPAVLNTCRTLEKQGFEVTYLNVDSNGFVDLEQLVGSIRKSTILITIMFANNEIGTIEPIQKIAEIAHNHHIIFHTDSVQAVGNVKINVEDYHIDLLSMSGHKLYAPKGIGALYVKEGIAFEKIQDGGHQEKDKRAGTENVAEIVGLGKAIEEIYGNYEQYNQHLLNLREQYIQQIEQLIPQAKLNGDRNKRLPGNANFSFPNMNGQELLLKLDEVGICASSGSACSTGSEAPSHVLTAIGLKPELAQGALRITFGKDNTVEDVNYLVNKIVQIIKK